MTFIRYVFIQLLAYGIDMGLFVVVLKSEMSGPIGSNIVAKLAAGLFAFIIHRSFTFQVVRPAPIRHQAFKYSLLLASNVPLTSGVLAFLLIWVHDPVVAKPLADSICIFLTFGLSKLFIFRDAASASEQTKPQQQSSTSL